MKGKTAGKIIDNCTVCRGGNARRVWWKNRYYAG